MKTNDIDDLLKTDLKQEFSPSPDLDEQTWQKMNAIPRKKRWFLLTLISIISFALLALQTIIILSYLQHTILKIALIYLCVSTICIIVFYQIISFNINLKRIL